MRLQKACKHSAHGRGALAVRAGAPAGPAQLYGAPSSSSLLAFAPPQGSSVARRSATTRTEESAVILERESLGPSTVCCWTGTSILQTAVEAWKILVDEMQRATRQRSLALMSPEKSVGEQLPMYEALVLEHERISNRVYSDDAKVAAVLLAVPSLLHPEAQRKERKEQRQGERKAEGQRQRKERRWKVRRMDRRRKREKLLGERLWKEQRQRKAVMRERKGCLLYLREARSSCKGLLKKSPTGIDRLRCQCFYNITTADDYEFCEDG